MRKKRHDHEKMTSYTSVPSTDVYMFVTVSNGFKLLEKIEREKPTLVTVLHSLRT
jgi:hypothetical protein